MLLILRGRGIRREDDVRSPDVVVVNEAICPAVFTGQDNQQAHRLRRSQRSALLAHDRRAGRRHGSSLANLPDRPHMLRSGRLSNRGTSPVW